LADKENFATMMRNFSIGFESNEVIVNNKKIFFLIFFFGVLFHFHPINCMQLKEEKEKFQNIPKNQEIPIEIITNEILPFFPFEDDFFVFVTMHYMHSKKLSTKIYSFFKKNKKTGLTELLVKSRREKPIKLKIYNNEKKSKKKGFDCIKRNAEWFWKNFEKIRDVLNNILNNIILIFHYRPTRFKNNSYCIDREIIKKIITIDKIRGLDLNDCFFSDPWIINLEYFKKFKNLQILKIGTLPQTRSLKKYYYDKFGDYAISCHYEYKHLNECKNIKSLDFSGHHILKENFNPLIKSENIRKNLEELRLCDCVVRSMNEYGKQLNIKSSLSDDLYLSDDDPDQISEELRALEHSMILGKSINKKKNRTESVSYFEYFAKLEKLQILDIGKIKITNNDLNAITNSKWLQKSLNELNFYKNNDINHFNIKKVSNLKSLRNLKMILDNATKNDCKNILFLIKFLPVIEQIKIILKNTDKNSHEYRLFLSLRKKSKNNGWHPKKVQISIIIW